MLNGRREAVTSRTAPALVKHHFPSRQLAILFVHPAGSMAPQLSLTSHHYSLGEPRAAASPPSVGQQCLSRPSEHSVSHY